MRCRTILTLLMIFCLLSSYAAASDIANLVRQMDSDKFSERKHATQQLSAMGASAIAAVKDAATSDSREVVERAFSILEGHFREGDSETKKAARAALEQLAATDGRAARRAKQILNPQPASNQSVQVFRPGQIIIGAPAIARVQIRQAGGNGRKFRMRVVNGVKDITVEEDGKKIEIKEDPNNGIKLEVTEKKDGKEATKKYEAKDAAQLKKNHPEAYKLYEKHAKQNGKIQIRAAAPAVPQQQRIAQMRKNHFDRMKKSIDDHIKRIEKQEEQAEGVRKDHYRQLVETLKRHRKNIEDMEKRQRTAPFRAP